MPTFVRATVAAGKVRDHFTRASVEPGGEVVLLVREPGADPERCPRHPRKGSTVAGQPCYCHGVQLAALLELGLVSDVRPYEPGKAKAEK